METVSPNYKSGFVAVLGRPNVGKSTLINSLLGTKIAAVSPWPQTTRRRQMGILTAPDAQIILIDTPGLHRPLHKLGEHMNAEVAAVLDECDVALFMVDVSQPPTPDDQQLAALLDRSKRPIPRILVLNKVDLTEAAVLEVNRAAYQALLPEVDYFLISATRGDNLEPLLSAMIARLPEGLPFFPTDQLTDLQERQIAADLIREAALLHLRAEVPHSIAVRIDEYTERKEEGAYIAATLFVERESQKGIIIGQGGTMLKKIGMAARKEVESLSGRKIYLSLRVKVRKNWRDDEEALRAFGFGDNR
jgi:GTP-binding protein Era